MAANEVEGFIFEPEFNDEEMTRTEVADEPEDDSHSDQNPKIFRKHCWQNN